MIRYNVTVSILKTDFGEWYKWMESKHIPDVLETGLFESCEIQKHIGDESDSEITVTFSYTCTSLENLETYRSRYAQALQKEHSNRYAGKFKAGRVVATIENRFVNKKISW